ncbi:hypothetical protein PTKIN_Ptkin08bG0200700 [Pterospermum kingtungense]
MQHLPVKSNLLDAGTEKNMFGFGGNEHPLCPKPRRLGPAIPELLKPLLCSKHSQPSAEGRSGVLNMIAEKLDMNSSLRQISMEENYQHAPAAPHPATPGHLRGEQVIHWFTTCISFIKWSFYRPSLEPSFRINLASPPLPLLFEY